MSRSHITEYPIPGAGPVGITRGADDNLWFTQYSANKIGRITFNGQVTDYPVPTDKSNPILIAPGPDGTAWFTENDGNKIGQIQISP